MSKASSPATKKWFTDSCWIGWACVCPFLACYVDAYGILEAERMIARDQGWEMAFYWSPLVFLAIRGILLIGIILPIGNMLTTWRKRLCAMLILLINLGILLLFNRDVHIFAKCMGHVYGLYPLSF